MIYPSSLSKLINSFERMPGVGEKSAERFALAIIEQDIDYVEEFSQNLLDAKKNITRCKQCGYIADSELCSICTNKSRNPKLICVVEDFKSVFRFENTGSFDGYYHVLGGLISPINGIYPDDIFLDKLVKRVKEIGDDVELIVALKPSIEGDTTTLYIKQLFKDMDVKVSRLSYGLPMGVDIDYLDPITIDRALSDRKDV